MSIFIFLFVRIPRKIYRIIFYKYEYFYYRFLYSKPKIEKNITIQNYLICRGVNLDNLGNQYQQFLPDSVQEKISQADSICNHIFDLLGSGPIKLSTHGDSYQPIDWHSDFKSGYTWDRKTFFRNIKYGHISGVDIKVPWELSRFQHLNILGQAYIITKDKKYIGEFVSQINDWINSNPVGFGVNWKCTMDVAIRATNWLVALEFFLNKGDLPKKFLHTFYTGIYEHGKFIRSHLEISRNRANNHYLADIVGLLFIAVYCPFFNESKKWLDFCIEELSKEIDKQIYDDGCSFEASTSYHRLVLEMIFYSCLLADRAGVSLPEKIKEKLKKMFDVSLYCIKPNGMIPQIGDNDSGRFLIFANRQILEHKYLLKLAAIYYNDMSFKLHTFDFDEEVFWIFGDSGKKIYDDLPYGVKSCAIKAFPNAGWHIIRNGNDYCFVSCGYNGQNGNGGHAHNDKLSFELMINGEDIFVDPGTYVYTSEPKERNKFRSTGYHNTIKFNGYEQNEISEKYLFNLPERVKINKADLLERDNNIFFQGEIHYSGIAHKRIITLDKSAGNWEIIDTISCIKPTNAKVIFHLSPDVFYNNGVILLKKTGKKVASIKIDGYKLEKGEYDYSSEYGIKVKAEYLFANISVDKDTKTITTKISKI